MKMRRIVAGCVLHGMRRRIDEKNRITHGMRRKEVVVQCLVKGRPFDMGSCKPDRLDDNIALLLAAARVIAPTNNEPFDNCDQG